MINFRQLVTYLLFFMRSLFAGNHDHKKNKQKTMKPVGGGLLEYVS